jgi:ADP-ribose pyrophosphatase YjhB (NUDIX family)/predicted ABC-type ATPase/transposase
MGDDEGEISRQIEEFLNELMNYGDKASQPRFEDKYGTLDTPEVWNQPIYDDEGNIIAPAYDGSDNHPFNLDINGNPIDVTKMNLLDQVLYRHWLSNGHFLREWTEDYPGSQVDRYKNLDEMVDVAVPPKELEDAFYKGDINSPDPLAMDQSVASGLDRLIEVIAADEPQWFTRDANGELIGDLNEITRSGSYGSGGMPSVNLSADDYSASQARTKLKEARDAAIKQEHDDLNSSTPASSARRAQLWNLFDSGTLSADEIAFDENLIDTQNLILALKRYALENNISTQKYNDARRVADTAALSRADEFTKKRIQRIKDEFVAKGLEPKDWAKAIDKEIDKQKSIVDKIEIEYSRFRTAFSRQMILVREIFATRPPNREQQTLRDGTILPGWDKSKESATQYLNRIRRWDALHLGTEEKPGPLGELLKKMRFSAREDGRDAASGATARITALAQRNISELQQLRNEYGRVRTQANQSGISGFMRLGGRDAEFYDTAKMSSRKAARQAAYGDFKFVAPNVLRRYDKAGLPISRAVRNSASGYNRNMTQEIADATNGSIKPVENNPGFRYLPPKLQQIARMVSDFADNTRDIKTSARETFKKVRGQKRQAQPVFNPADAEKLDISRARAYTSRLIDYKPTRLSDNAKRIYGGGISGAMQLYTEEFPDGNWYVVNELGHKLFPQGHPKHEDALHIANLYQREKRGELPYAPTDQTMRTAARLGQRLGEYTGDRNFELDVADSITPWVLGNDSKPMQEAGDAVILRTNPETGEREILLIERLFGPHTAQTRSLSLPGGMRNDDEELRDTAQREALEEVNVTDKDVIRMEHLGEIEARDWDPRFVNGARISGVVLEVSPDTDVRAGDDASTAAWYSLERISGGTRPLAFGHAAWVALALAGTDDEALHDRFVNLNAISRRRQQRIISGVNAARERISIETGQKLKLFPRPTENADSGYTAFGPDAELHNKRIMKWARERRNGGITGAMAGRYFRGPITSWSSDNLSKDERDKIMKDVIALRRTELNPVLIARSINAKWETDNFTRADGGIHSFNPQQVKDVIYKARMDGVTFAKLRDEKPAAPVQSAENIKFIAQRSFVGGHSASDIANELDISTNEVIKVQRAIGLSSIHADKQKAKRNNESARVVELIGNGKTFKEVAKELGLTEAVARNRYKSALSAGNITGSMGVDKVPFSKFIEMSKEGEELRKTNLEAFYSKTYERISNSEIAKTLGIKASEVNDAVQNHLDFIENNKTEILSTYEKAFQNSKKNLTPAENRHMKMRFDGMPIDKIAEIEGTDVLDAITSESLILAKLRGQNRELFERKMAVKEKDLINAPINSQRGLPKRVYVAVKHDGLDIETIAKAEDITPAQARDSFKKYSDALEKTDNANTQLLRRAIILNGSNLNDSQKQFIDMRLDGVSIRDMAYLHGKDVVEVKIDQAETMNRFNSSGITGAMGFPRKQYKDNDYYDILGIAEDANDKELRTAYRKAARETHPDLNPGDKNNEALFKKISEAYSVLSNPEERLFYDSVRPTERRPRRQQNNATRTPKRTNVDDSGNPFPVTTTLGEDFSYIDPITGKRVPDWYVREQQGLPPRWKFEPEDVPMGDLSKVNRNPFGEFFDDNEDNDITGSMTVDGTGPEEKKNRITYRGKRWKDKKVSIFEPILSFRSQVSQYPESGPSGVSYFRGEDDELRKKGWWVDALLYRDKNGKILGILNHYPQNMPAEQPGGPSEKKGNVNIFIDPKSKRSGIASELLKEAVSRYKVDLNKQRYSKEGAAFVNSFVRSLPENSIPEGQSITGSMKVRQLTPVELNREKRSAKSKPRRWTDEEIDNAALSGINLKGRGITGRMSDDTTRKALEDLMRDANEPLDKDLESFVEFNNEIGMPIVRHPLVMWIGPMMPGMINQQYRQKLEAVGEARKSKNWSSYIYLHERPYRLDAFMDVKDEMDDKDYWSLLSDIWVDSENIWQNKDLWKSALSSKRPGKSNMMKKDELDELDSLPDKIKIYRGYIKGKNQNGLSWTTDKAKATWFSGRLARGNEKPLVAEATVNKKDVVAYFTRRGESEVVLSRMPKITGAMGLFERFTKNEPAKPNPVPFTPKNLPKMNDSIAKRLGFKGKLTTYNPSNYTSLRPATTIGTFLAQKDEPFVGLDATFGGTTKIKEERFWDLYQPIAVALSKAVTAIRKDGEPKRFISVGGPPGSGKSTLRLSGKHDIPSVDAAVHIDADEMKTLIPEAIEMHRNGNPNWGDASHEESRIMADVALKVGLENGHDVVYDSTGQFNSGFGTLKAARDKGYEIIAHYNVSPENVLVGRIDEREKSDPRRLPRHIIPAVNRRNYDIMPTVAKSADEFYLWDTNVTSGQEPKLLARKIKGGELEILDSLAYAHGKFDDSGQAVDMSKPDFKMNAKKVSKNSFAGKIIAEYESGVTVEEIAKKQKISKHQVFDAITMNEIDPNLPDVVYAPQPAYQPTLFPGSKPRLQESLSDSQAMNQFRNLSTPDKAVLRDFVAKKPGVSLDDMTERVPMDLVIWTAKQKPEHTQPLGQIRSIEKLENLSPSKRQQLTEMLQAGETVVEIANALNLPFSVIDVAMDFVDQYGYIPEGGDTEEKTAMFDSVSGNRLARIVGKTIKASMLNGVVIHER